MTHSEAVGFSTKGLRPGEMASPATLSLCPLLSSHPGLVLPTPPFPPEPSTPHQVSRVFPACLLVSLFPPAWWPCLCCLTYIHPYPRISPCGLEGTDSCFPGTRTLTLSINQIPTESPQRLLRSHSTGASARTRQPQKPHAWFTATWLRGPRACSST